LTGKVLDLLNVINPDQKATRLTERYIEWETLRQVKKNDWEEIRRYIYATDTTQTTNNQLPWKNKTTVPKLCQIRDNLLANYGATLFPSQYSKWLEWQPAAEESADAEKALAITNYMNWVITQPQFKHELDKIIMDYVDFGNGFGTVEWVDQRSEQPDKTQVGFVGPMIKRISPLDTVMNPTAENYIQSPKFIRTLISMGEVRRLLERLSNDENRHMYEELFKYLKEIRFHARTFQGDWIQRDRLYQMDGFSSYRHYLLSNWVEIITLYGDWYDFINDEYQENRVITVIDRHKIVDDRPNPSYFGYPPIFHVPWRKKQDNLWGMGPLDNLVGMQYRLDHVENMKADVFDLVTYPVQKVKGFVQDFVWQPGEKIFVSEDGDVEMIVPDVQALNANLEIQHLEQQMEEMAGAPREAMGFRSPGEKTKYEVQSLENAAARIFQHKIKQFEEQMLEPLLNAMLELARRNMTGPTTIRVMDDEFKLATFQTLTVDDITGIGRIRPVAARHFAEQSVLVQNLTNLAGSNLWPTVQPHISGIKLAKMFEKTFNIEEYEMVVPYIALAEQMDAQKQAQALEEQLHQYTMTATGMNGDYDMDFSQDLQQQQQGQSNVPGMDQTSQKP